MLRPTSELPDDPPSGTTVNRWTYFAALALLIASVVIGDSGALSQGGRLLLVIGLVALAVMWHRYADSQTQPHEFGRIYDASRDATFNALCGALTALSYKVTQRDSDTSTVHFKGGDLGPWIGRPGVEGSASVRRISDSKSEIAISCRVLPADKHGKGWLLYPEGLSLRMKKVFDRVQASTPAGGRTHPAAADREAGRRLG
jgi:hypothetical protein